MCWPNLLALAFIVCEILLFIETDMAKPTPTRSTSTFQLLLQRIYTSLRIAVQIHFYIFFLETNYMLSPNFPFPLVLFPLSSRNIFSCLLAQILFVV